MPSLITLMLIVTLSAGCSLPPEPPTVDGTSRQKVNNVEKTEKKFNIKPLKTKPKTQPKSQIFHIYFPLNSSKVKLNVDESISLNLWLTKGHHIEIRGRTDGQNPSLMDEKVALDRALAVKAYLIEQGVTSAIISINYLSAGDYIADNTSQEGRKQNRRVDLEIVTQDIK